MARTAVPITERINTAIDIIIHPYSGRVPLMTCTRCGKQYYYRGLIDSAALDGFEPAVCKECRSKFSGGAYDGMTVGDLYD